MSTSLRIRTSKSHFQEYFFYITDRDRGKRTSEMKRAYHFPSGYKFHQNWLNNKEIMPIILQFHFAAGPSPRRKIAYFIRKKIPRKVLNFTTLNYHNFFLEEISEKGKVFCESFEELYLMILSVFKFSYTLKSWWVANMSHDYHDKARKTPYFASWHLGDSLGVYRWNGRVDSPKRTQKNPKGPKRNPKGLKGTQ